MLRGEDEEAREMISHVTHGEPRQNEDGQQMGGEGQVGWTEYKKMRSPSL